MHGFPLLSKMTVDPPLNFTSDRSGCSVTERTISPTNLTFGRCSPPRTTVLTEITTRSFSGILQVHVEHSCESSSQSPKQNGLERTTDSSVSRFSERW